jgi:hypothetical protein
VEEVAVRCSAIEARAWCRGDPTIKRVLLIQFARARADGRRMRLPRRGGLPGAGRLC